MYVEVKFLKNSAQSSNRQAFFANFNFKTALLLKWRPIFDELSADGDTKFGNFIWLQLIFGQKPCFLGPRQVSKQKVNIHY